MFDALRIEKITFYILQTVMAHLSEPRSEDGVCLNSASAGGCPASAS